MTSRYLLGVVLVVGLAAPVMAAWPNDPTVNVPLSNAIGNQGGNGPAVVPSIDGGAIVAWRDERFTDYDIYAQRIDGKGVVQWTVDGVPVCDVPEIQMNVRGVTDGAGGAILVWSDMRAGQADIYAQRIDVDGNPMWPVGAPSLDGIPVCVDTDHQSWVSVVGDGAGGAIIVWEQGNTPNDLYAQRLGPDGEIQWPVGAPTGDGVVVTDAPGVQIWSRVVADGVGGAVLVWTDGRNNPTTSFDIYAQRINGSGLTLWPGDLPVCVNDRAQTYPAIATDGAGGAFIAWHDPGPADYIEVWAQYIDHTGTHHWTSNGIVLNDTSISTQHTLRGVTDGQGGAIFVWEDLRDWVTNGKDLYGQRVNSLGPVWTAGGVVLSAAAGNQRDPAVAAPRDGSVVIAWRDGRVGESDADVYALEIIDGTTIVGPPDGLAVSTAQYAQNGPVVGVSGWNDAMIVWNDSRNLATGTDVYAQGVFLIAIFADGFESGNTMAWSAMSP